MNFVRDSLDRFFCSFNFPNTLGVEEIPYYENINFGQVLGRGKKSSGFREKWNVKEVSEIVGKRALYGVL